MFLHIMQPVVRHSACYINVVYCSLS